MNTNCFLCEREPENLQGNTEDFWFLPISGKYICFKCLQDLKDALAHVNV